jgi:hypothetical protein
MFSKRLLIVVIIFAVDVFAAFVWLFYAETPGYVFSEMRRRLSAATSIRIQYDIAIEGSANLPDFAFFLSGAAAPKKEYRGGATIHGSADLDLRDLGLIRRADVWRVSLTRLQTEPINYSGEMIFLGEKRYLLFADLPETDVSNDSLRGNWVGLPDKSLDFPGLGAIKETDVDQKSQIKLRSLFRSAKLLATKRELPEATIDGARHYHHEAVFRPEAWRALSVLGSGIREKRSLTGEEIARLDEEINRFNIRSVEIWIRKRDYFPSRVLIQGLYEERENSVNLPFSATLTLSRPNEPVEISGPARYQPLSEHLRLLGGSGLSLSANRDESQSERGSAAPDQEKVMNASSSKNEWDDDPDHDNLSNVLEAFYGSDPRNPDTDNDGFQDGFEVMNGFDPAGPGKLFDFR